MNVIQCPFVKFHVHDDNGYPASGWKLYTFRAGTDEALTAYKDASGTVEYGAFVLMNSRGEPNGDGIFLEEGVAYKLILKRPDGSTAWSQPYVLASGSSGSSVPAALAARSLYGNTASSTGDAGAVPIDSVLTEGNNSIPSSKAVYDALASEMADVVRNSGEQAIDGSLDVSGSVSVGSLAVGGEDVDSRFVRVDGHQGQSLVGRSATGSGPVSDVPIAESIDVETNGSSVPTVAAVRGALSGLDDGLVKTNVGDTAGYLSGKVVGDGSTADVSLVGNKLVVSVDSQLVARIGANDGLSMVNAEDSMGYLADKIEAGPGASVEVTESNKLKVTNTLPDTMMTKAHALSSVPGFISSLMQAGTGINLALSADMEKIVLTATGSVVGGFYWKGTWSTEGTYNVNNAVWYFDHTGELPVSRLYIATTQNQGINPFTDAGIGTGTCWSCMMAVDYMGDQFVMLDASDTQAGYLSDKLKAGQYVTLTRTADANGVWYTVDCAAPYTVKTNGTTKTYADMGGKIEIVGTGGTTTYWYGTQLMVQSITLGDGSTNAYPGDKGKIAYTHSQAAHAPANADNTQAAIAAASAKTTPVDADVVPILDSAASWAAKKLTWANVKATLKAYLNGVYEPKLTAGDTAKYYRGDKTWQDLAGTVRSTVLTGIASGTNAAIAATDTVLVGLAKLQAQLSSKQSLLTFDSTPADGSANPVTSNGIFDALSQKVSTYKNYWNATYVSDSHRWVKIASITTSDSDYTTHCLFVGKSFYGAVHYLQGHLLIAQNGTSTASVPAISFVGQQRSAKVYYTFDDTANLLEIYLYMADGSGGGLTGGITTNIITSTDPSRITLLTSGTALASVAGAIEVKYLTVNPKGGNVASNSNLVIDGGSAIIGNTHVGNWSGGSDRARFGHSSHNNASGFGFIQNSAGSASISVPAAQEIHFGVGAAPATRIDANGFLHINPPAPSDDTDTVPTTAWVKDVAAPLSHTHGNISNAGAIGTTSGLPVVTTTNGVLTTAAWSTTNPNMDGTASVGSSTVPSRSDHRHPSDTSRLALGDGLSAGASVVVRAYSKSNTYNANVIYMEY